MNNQLYATFDLAAKRFNERVFQVPTDEVAIRVIRDSAENDTTFKKNAKDYELWRLGEYKPETGKITPNNHRIGNVADLLGMAEPATQAPLKEQTIKGGALAPTSRTPPCSATKEFHMDKQSLYEMWEKWRQDRRMSDRELSKEIQRTKGVNHDRKERTHNNNMANSH